MAISHVEYLWSEKNYFSGNVIKLGAINNVAFDK